jgi:hypothetical protein
VLLSSNVSRIRADLRCSSVNLFIMIARPILQPQASIAEASKVAEIEWRDTLQTALRKTVLTRSLLIRELSDSHRVGSSGSSHRSSLSYSFAGRAGGKFAKPLII